MPNVQNNLSGFQVSSPQRGIVALRINYPYQSATMSGFQPHADPMAPISPTNPVVPIPADDNISVLEPASRRRQSGGVGLGVRPVVWSVRSWKSRCLGRDCSAVPKFDFGPSNLSTRGFYSIPSSST